MKMILSNFISGARWEPPYFEVVEMDSDHFLVSRLRTLDGNSVVSGIATNIFAFNGKFFSKTFIALYVSERGWFFYDGSRKFDLKLLRPEWSRPIWAKLLGIAVIKLNYGDFKKTIFYIRPWFRHFFEQGWDMDDIDLMAMLPHLIENSSARENLLYAFKRHLL